MPANSEVVHIIAETLLQHHMEVAEIAPNLDIERTWRKEEVGLFPNVNEGNNANLASLPDQHPLSAVGLYFSSLKNTGEVLPSCHEIRGTIDGKPVSFSIAIATNHPQPNYFFVALKVLPTPQPSAPCDGKWKQVMDAVGDGTWELDYATNEIKVSNKWQEIFGYTQDELKQLPDWHAKLHPDDIITFKQRLEEYRSGAIPIYSNEIRYRDKNGAYKWIYSRGIEVHQDDEKRPLLFMGTHTDIHERKVADERHLATLRLLTTLIDNIQEGIMVTDEHGKVVYANQMFISMFNYSVGADFLKGKDIMEYPVERQVQVVDEYAFVGRLSAIVADRRIVIGDEFVLTDGRIIARDYIPLSIDPTNKGQIWKFKDVTVQKNISLNFRKQREFYERILNNIPAEIAVYDQQQKYIFVNPAGISSAEKRQWIIGKDDFEYCRYTGRPESIATERTALIKNIVNTGAVGEYEECLEETKDKERYYLRRMYPVMGQNGEMEMVIGYGVDITRIKKAEVALKTSMDTFSSAFSHAAIGIGLVYPDGRYKDVNQAICDITGYSRDELLQSSFQEITYPDDLAEDLENAERLLRKEISSYSMDKRYVSKDGRIVWVLLTVSLVWDSNGMPDFFIAQIIDISKQRTLQDEIKRQNRELEATRGSLVNKITQLEELSHMVAHNLRGPVNNIKLISESLLTDDPEDQLFTTAEAGSLIVQSCTNLINSLNALMELTQIKLNQNIKYDSCVLSSVFKEVSNQLLSSIFEKHARIITNFEVEEISYPKVYLESIFYNIISNAVKYSSSERTPEITVSSFQKDGWILLSIKDNGMGIDLVKNKDKIFKLNQIFHEGFESKGVGLYMTKTQVEALGGSIEVGSTVNVGTEFVVTLKKMNN